MHTFFVNTSEGLNLEQDDYDILEIPVALRRLVLVPGCPLAKWTSNVSVDDRGVDNERRLPETYFERCARLMGEQIDSYRDINNKFNVVIYVDLLEIAAYCNFPKSEPLRLYRFLEVLRSLICHFINRTLIETLRKAGRTPREVVVVFEQNEWDSNEGNAKATKLIYTQRMEALRLLTGLPDDEKLFKIAQEYHKNKTEETRKLAVSRVCEKAGPGVLNGLLASYSRELGVFLDEVVGERGSVLANKLTELVEMILEADNNMEDGGPLSWVDFQTDRMAGVVNKRVNTARNLRLCFYLLSCVREGTLLDRREGSDENSAADVRQFPVMDDRKWELVEQAITEKRRQYEYISIMLNRGSQKPDYELHLAPQRMLMETERFGLDKFGHIDKEAGQPHSLLDDYDTFRFLEEQGWEKAVEAPSKKKDDKQDKRKGKPKKTLLKREDADGSEAERYRAVGDEYLERHRSALDYIEAHFNAVLSHYSQAPKILLTRRKVSVADDALVDEPAEYRYTDPIKGPIPVNPDDPVQSDGALPDLVKQSYKSVQEMYQRFCVTHKIQQTDLGKQVDRYKKRINEVDESKKNNFAATVMLTLCLLLLYVPYLVIQWSAIVANMGTVLIGVLSLAFPVVVLWCVAGVINRNLSRQFKDILNDLKKQSDAVWEINRGAVEAYDLLLSYYIPTLRWVYEHKLDAEFYGECCKLAVAKRVHHQKMVNKRRQTVADLNQDMEFESNSVDIDRITGELPAEQGKLEYFCAFCVGDVNQRFYSIVDDDLLDSIMKEGGKQE